MAACPRRRAAPSPASPRSWPMTRAPRSAARSSTAVRGRRASWRATRRRRLNGQRTPRPADRGRGAGRAQAGPPPLRRARRRARRPSCSRTCSRTCGRRTSRRGRCAGCTRAAALAGARTCYDHLAGRLGVAVTDAMTQMGLLDRSAGAALTPAAPVARGRPRRRRRRAARGTAAARAPVRRLDGAAAAPRGRRRSAGVHALPGAGMDAADRYEPAMLVTPAGRMALRDLLGIDADALAA